MKCAIGRVLEPDTTIVDGSLKQCENEGEIPCSQCRRMYCIEHAPKLCEACHKVFCVECEYDHLSDNTAHPKVVPPN
jgi:hypothetical protein